MPLSSDTTTDPSTTPRRLAAIILAAGKGTRMNSDLPKVMHQVAGRAMVWWVVEAVRSVGASPIVLVVGYGQDSLRELFGGDDDDLLFAEQPEQLGTGHAVLCAERSLRGFDGDVLVLCGDGPLIRPSTLEAILERHARTGAAATLATAVLDDPSGYGRIVRSKDGRFEAIIEQKVASPEQLSIREVNPSYYCFDRAMLFETLREVRPSPSTGEIYVTDVPGLLKGRGRRVEVIDAVPPEDVLSINTPEELAKVDSILSARVEANA